MCSIIDQTWYCTSKQAKERSRIPLNGRLTFVVQHVHAFQKGWDVVDEFEIFIKYVDQNVN